jgi:hypothetical protein
MPLIVSSAEGPGVAGGVSLAAGGVVLSGVAAGGDISVPALPGVAVLSAGAVLDMPEAALPSAASRRSQPVANNAVSTAVAIISLDCVGNVFIIVFLSGNKSCASPILLRETKNLGS